MKNERNTMVSNLFFPSFSLCRWMIIALNILSVMMAFILVFKTDLNSQNLKELSEMVINIQFILAALVVSIASIEPENKNNSKNKNNKELILNYIGSILATASIGVLGYGLSYVVDIFDTSGFTIKLYSIAMLICVNNGITNSTKYIMKIFNIK